MATQMHEDVIHAQPIVTATRSAAGTSVSINSTLSGDVVLPCICLVFRGTTVAPITALTVSAVSGSTLTVSATAPAGWVDAQVNAGDVLQFPEAVVLSLNGTANSLLLNTSYTPEIVLTDGATITADCSASNRFAVTITSTGRTLAFSNVTPGQEVTVRVIQGSGGSKTITTYPGTVAWASGSAPTLTTTAAHYDVIRFRSLTSTTFYGVLDLADAH